MLMLHGPSKTIEELKAIPLPGKPRWAQLRGPEDGNWRPINHGELVETLLRVLDGFGLQVKENAWETNEGGTDLFGAIDIASGTPTGPAAGTGMAIGLRHSNAGRHAVTLAFGAKVFVCSNGVILGSTVVQRRHTLNLDLVKAFEAAVEEYLDASVTVRAFIERLRVVPLGRHEAEKVMIDAGRKGVVPWALLKTVEEQWRRPRHDEFRPRTAWSLYNAFTEATKVRGVAGQMETLDALQRIFTPIAMRNVWPEPDLSIGADEI